MLSNIATVLVPTNNNDIRFIDLLYVNGHAKTEQGATKQNLLPLHGTEYLNSVFKPNNFVM